jgi:uncharacterized protein YidB (DUF937 family)
MGMIARVTAGLERQLDDVGADGLAMAAAKFVPGGLPALLDRLRGDGHGAAVDSWIGTGENHLIPAEAYDRVLTPGVRDAFARDLGLRPERVAQSLAAFLPAAVDRESPGGQLREQRQFSTQIR